MTLRTVLRLAAAVPYGLLLAIFPLMAQTTTQQNQLRANPTAQPAAATRTTAQGQVNDPRLQPQPINNAQGMMPGGQGFQPAAGPLPQPFALSPQEQAELGKLLTDWEKQSNAVKFFSCKFTRLEYNPAFTQGNPNQPSTESTGEIKYAAPDKGMFRVKEMSNFVFDPQTKKYKKDPVGAVEWWTCDGKSTYQVNEQQKLVEERPLPPAMQGKAIADGPLPFVFGAKREVLERRYYLRITTPLERANDEVWLEAFPKTQDDAANLTKVDLILTKPNLQPTAIQIYNPGSGPQNQSRTVIRLESVSINNPWAPVAQMFQNFAAPNPFGFKRVIVGAPAAAGGGAQPQNGVPAGGVVPAGNQVPPGQAARIQQLPR